MIYEICDGFLESVQNQWRDLSDSFKRLAQTQPYGTQIEKNRVDSIGNPNAGGGRRGIELDAYVQGQNDDAGKGPVQQDREFIPSLSIRDMVEYTQAALRRTNLACLRVEGIFNGVFGNQDVADLVEETISRTLINELKDYISRGLQELNELGSPDAQSSNLNRLRGTVEDIASYPMLTSDMNITPIMPSSSGGSGLPSLQRVIDNTMRQVLGRLPKPNDPRSFQAALVQSFDIKEFEGHTIFKWTPRSYSGQTELGGGVTGAQASLYSRAKVSVDQSLPLLDGLYPLLPDSDEQLVSAAKAIVRAEVTQLVQELGVEGGPRVARVNGFFESLLKITTIDEVKKVPIQNGHLGYLQAVMGLNNDQVNTLEEETNVTNFILLHDYISSLENSWNIFSTQWYGKDMGTRLVLLSRALSVTADAVNEVLAAMDSVFVGSAERQVATFRDGQGRTILVEELLTWVVSFAAEEAPLLVHDGGRQGVVAIIPTAQRLVGLVAQLTQSIDYDPMLPTGLRHPRVKNPLRELNSYLKQIERIAQDIYRPVHIQ